MMRTLAARLRGLLVAPVGALVALAACGGHSQTGAEPHGDAGVTAVEGSIAGVSLARGYAVAIPDNSNATGEPTNEYTVLAIGIASKTLACASAGLPNSALIGISIKRQGTAPVGPGSYTINTDQTSSLNNNAALITTDAKCAESSPANCIGGTVTITEATEASVTGTFILAFDTGEAMHGTFTAVICPSIPPSLRGETC